MKHQIAVLLILGGVAASAGDVTVVVQAPSPTPALETTGGRWVEGGRGHRELRPAGYAIGDDARRQKIKDRIQNTEDRMGIPNETESLTVNNPNSEFCLWSSVFCL
jgi:hypothetical protein